jgi:hypothetical protein
MMLPSRCAGWTVGDVLYAGRRVGRPLPRPDRRPAIGSGPDAASLALVRRVLDGLLGAPLPARWDDITCALTGTGRLAVTAADRSVMGALAERLPLFG